MTTPPPPGPANGTPVQILFGRYIIHRLLGMGGMAEIYQATVSGPGGFEKPVVIKRVRSQHATNDNFVQMFVDEARICASLDHANLVTVFDFGEEDGHYYMAMELIDGIDLRTAHVRHAQLHGQPVPWEASLVVVRDALRGLDYAHHLAGPDGQPLGIVHRDIDLANIMVRRDGAVKVLDFGCAKASGAIRRTQTVAGVIKGKLGYMSPEQAEDRPLDARSDVFAASIVLHELLTGRRLFFGDDPLAVIQSVLQRPIPDPRDKNPSVPESLVRVVMRGLARSLEERYPSAAAMADDLDHVVHEHRLGQARVAEIFAPLMAGDPNAMGTEITQDQRKMTLAAWSESTGDDEPLEIISGVLVGENGAEDSDVANAPFIDATIVVTNPRWMLPDAPASQQDLEAAVSSAPAAAPTPTPAEPEVSLHAELTEMLAPEPQVGIDDSPTAIISQEAPPLALTDQQTVLLTEEDRKGVDVLAPPPTSPANAVPTTLASSEPTAPVVHPSEAPRSSNLPWYLLIAILSVAAGLALYFLVLR